MRNLALSYTRVLKSIIEACVIPYAKILGEAEGLLSPNEKELETYIRKNVMLSSSLIDLYSRIDLAMIYSLVWSFGLALNPTERAKFNIQMNQDLVKVGTKYKYPENSDVFNTCIDWTEVLFGTLSETPMTLHALVPSAHILVPTIDLTRVVYMINNLTFPKNLQFLGDSCSGKSSLVNYISDMHANKYQSFYYTVNPLLSASQFQKSINKAISQDHDIKNLLIVEDVHLDKDYETHVLEVLKYWISHGGCYDPIELSFKPSKNTSFITTAQNNDINELSADSNAHRVWLSSPDQKIFKQILVNCVFQRKNSVEILVHRYLKVIISVFVHASNHYTNCENWTRQRVIQGFKNLLHFTSTLEESDRKDEEKIAEIISHELKRTFRDSTKDVKEFDTKLAEIIYDKLRVSKYNPSLLFGDFTDPNTAMHNSLVSYSLETYDSVQTKVVKAVTDCENGTLSIAAFAMNPSGLEFLWSICRILQGEGLHGIIQVPSGLGPYECLQMACVLKHTRLIQPDVKQFGDFKKFQQEFEEALLSVFYKLKKENSNPNEAVQCLFLLQTAHGKDKKYLDLLNWFIISDIKDLSHYSAGFLEKMKVISQERIFRSKVLNSDENPILIVLKLMKRYFHVVIVISSLEDYQNILNIYPKLISKAELVVEYSPLDYAELSCLVENYLKYKKIDTELTEIITESYMHIKGSYERNDFTEIVDRQNLSDFLCPKRLILFIDVFSQMLFKFKEKLIIYKENLSKMLEKTKQFQSMHVQLGNSMSFLQEYSMKTSSNINLTKGQIEKLRKSQAGKQELIDEKEKSTAILQEELENLQKENEEIIASKDMRLEKTFNTLTSFLQRNNIMADLVKANEDKSVKLFEALVAVSGKDENESIMETLEQTNILIGNLRYKHEGPFSKRIFNLMTESLKIEKRHIKDPFLITVYDYIDAIVQRLQVVQLLHPQIARTDELKNEIANNNVSITYAQKYIMDVERDLRRCLDRERLFSSELEKRKEKLKTSEVTHIRTDNLINAVSDLNAKVRKMMASAESTEKNLIGDCLILASSSVFYGHLNSKNRIIERSVIYRNLEAREIQSDER